MKQAKTEAARRVTLKANVFGEFHIHALDGEEIVLSNRRAVLLLAMLCLEPNQSMERETLARLLWADRFLPQAKASLRQCLLELKRKLEDAGIDDLIVTRREVALREGSLACDNSHDRARELSALGHDVKLMLHCQRTN